MIRPPSHKCANHWEVGREGESLQNSAYEKIAESVVDCERNEECDCAGQETEHCEDGADAEFVDEQNDREVAD